MRQDKALIQRFRQEGWSYRQIQQETGVSRATLTTWFGTNPLSKSLTKTHMVGQDEASRERMVRLNMVRKLKLQYHYALVESEATKEYQQYKAESLFWAGLMLYAGRGDVGSRGMIRMSSDQFHSHRIFRFFLQKYLGVKDSSIRHGITIYSDQDQKKIEELWSKELDLNPSLFHKTQILQGKEGTKRLQSGIGMSILSNTALKKKLLKWLLLVQDEKFDAGMVQG